MARLATALGLLLVLLVAAGCGAEDGGTTAQPDAPADGAPQPGSSCGGAGKS